MANISRSPAAASMRREQAYQAAPNDDAALEDGLKSTFPASDPVASTITAIPSGTSGPSDAPRVDEALRATAGRDNEELHALTAEISSLREKAGLIGSEAGRLVRSEASEALEAVERRIRSKPIAAVAMAAAVGYLWGLTR